MPIIHVPIKFVVVSGYATEADLVAWAQDALAEYHRFRMGFVGIDCHAGIKPPKVLYGQREDSKKPGARRVRRTRPRV